VIGENVTFMGEEDLLRDRGVAVDVLQDARCIEMMRQFILEHLAIWNEDIGCDPGGVAVRVLQARAPRGCGKADPPRPTA